MCVPYQMFQVFAASKLCIANLKSMSDPSFRGLARAANEWIDIEEVRNIVRREWHEMGRRWENRTRLNAMFR